MFGLKNSFKNNVKNSIIMNGNGETVITNSSSVIIGDGNIIVGNKIIKSGLSGVVELKVEGDLMEIQTTGNVTNDGNVHGDVDTTGNVNCGDVGGNVDTTGTVNCKAVHGNIDTVGSVNIRK